MAERRIQPTEPQWDFLSSEKRYRAFVGGVGSGKTFAGAVLSLMTSRESKARGAIIAPTYAMLKDATLKSFEEIAGPAMREMNRADLRCEIQGGAEILFRSADKPDRLRGTNLGWFWMDEAALMSEETWDIMLGRMRLQPGRAWITTTPRGKDWIWKRFVRDGRSAHEVIRASTHDNIHLPDEYVRGLEEQYTARFRQQEVEGAFIDVEGALWGYGLIEATRVRSVPAVRRVVIGVDPAGGGPDEIGIMVCAEGQAGHSYVIEDGSMRGKPNEWARRVATLAKKHDADRIVAERNFGGDMVESTLRTAEATLPVKVTSTSRGKMQRAEPVAALYEQHKVHHVGTFSQLEEQMTTFTPSQRSSPDRLDALVWALTELMLGRRSLPQRPHSRVIDPFA